MSLFSAFNLTDSVRKTYGIMFVCTFTLSTCQSKAWSWQILNLAAVPLGEGFLLPITTRNLPRKS